MGDIIGKKAKTIEIAVPINEKIKGRIIDVKQSQKFDNCLDIVIEFPEHRILADDGIRQFSKRAFYSIQINWSHNNKAGRLFRAIEGRFPEQDGVNWTKLLLEREVECIFEDAFDKDTGAPKGQRIKWMGGVSDNPADLKKEERGRKE